MATRQGARGAAQTQIRARITYVGSEYRKDVTSGTCSSASPTGPRAHRPRHPRGRRSLYPCLRNGRSFLSKKARRAKRENAENRSSKRARDNPVPVMLVTVSSEYRSLLERSV